MYSRHRLDISPRHLLYAGAACLWARGADRIAERIEATSPEQGALVCFSVRSGFELLLEALALPAGSEVLVSAVTHPDMARIIERRGLAAIPIDLEPAKMAPRLELLEATVTPQTRAVLIAHLFGARVDLSAIAELARRHGLLLLEDCAQSFEGPAHAGDPRADVSMFSFGSIKTATALGGAILVVRDPATLARMREIQAGWPLQPRREYLAKALKFAGLLLISGPRAYGLFARACALAGRDLDEVVNGAVRALPAGRHEERFERWLRRRASAPLLALLAHRLRTFDAARLRRRAAVGEEVARSLPPGLLQPGRTAPARTHWVFPVSASSPRKLISALRSAGFDATQGTSAIAAVEAPADRAELEPLQAIGLMSSIVFLPVYPELPERAVRRLVDELATIAGEAPADSPQRPVEARVSGGIP